MPKQVYSWSNVKPGDIISFRYKGKKTTANLTTIMVLNPKIQLYKQKKFYVVGLKLEDKGVIPHIRNKNEMIELLERIGVIQVVDSVNEIFKVDIYNVGPRGFRQQNYQKVKKFIEQNKAYRTYVWEEATNSQVFLEPVSIPKSLKEALFGN
tara:strand:- start:448 stop:903 length:456 start_codon:yes stop_codon:yes gene_type:complete